MMVLVAGAMGCGQNADLPTSRTPLGTALLVGGAPSGGTQVPSGSVPVPVPVPVPNPTPASTPKPTPKPSSPPSSGAGPVAKLAVKVLFVVCDNEGVPDSEGLTRIPVGCKVHLDLNAKDDGRNPTDTEETPNWDYSREALVRKVDEEDFYQVFEAVAPGDLRITVSADGIRSNDLWLTLYR